MWGALVAVVVFQVTLYGVVVSSAPSAIPSRRNWTPVTPVLSEAVAERVTVMPVTVEPAVGVEREMVGARVSGATRVVPMAVVEYPERFPAASSALMRYTYAVEAVRRVSEYEVMVGVAI